MFIVIDESVTVGEANYNTAISFIRNFVVDLDKSVRPTLTILFVGPL